MHVSVLHIEKTKNCSNLQLLMKHELGNDCGSLLLVFVLLVRVLAGSGGRGRGKEEWWEGERKRGGREKEREDYTHEQDDLLCWVEGNEIEC